MTVTVRVAVRATPEHRERFLAQLAREEQDVPARFDGCERFRVYAHASDENELLLYEEWATRAAFDAYRTSEYFARAGAVLKPLLKGPPDSAYYDAVRIGP